MVSTRFYLDCRNAGEGKPAPLKLVITKKRVRSLISLGIFLLPSQWDAYRQIVVAHPQRQLYNTMLAERKVALDAMLQRLLLEGGLRNLSANEVRDRILAELYPQDYGPKPITFLAHFDKFADAHSPGSRRLYMFTRARLKAFLGDRLEALKFEEMNVAWLRKFDAFLALTSPSRNSRNIHFRNIRAVFNDAITEELITCYPFRKFKTTPERTRKRALTIEQLRAIFTAEVLPHEQRYLDCFKLIFMLCGINIVDLCGLRGLVNGRAEYERAKTHRLYSIKVESEAQAIIDRYAGTKYLLNYMDTCANYRNFYTRLNTNLHAIGARVGVPGLSTYWARHSWATMAASLDIPKETIAAGLGHGGNTVTDIYIDFDQKKVDVANRRVLDFVLYGKV
ncbi:MAG: site-specific integrase [Muribaculaceae bacterium]|nr:site-specific integrase [Muribaculaceae bacterium]